MRAQGQQYPVGTAQGFGACLAGGVHRSQRLVGRRGRERAVEPVVEPQFAVEVQLGMLYGRLVRIAAQRGGDGERVEQDARGVCDDAEPGFGEPSRDVFGEAGTEGQDAVPVSDFSPRGAQCRFRCGIS